MIFVHTSYHLLQAVNQILSLYNDADKYIIDVYVRVAGAKRLAMPLDFSHLPVNIHYFYEEVSKYRDLNDKERTEIQSLVAQKPDIFIFFQEQDPLMVILSNHYARTGTEVHLYEDGLKPYVNLRFHSLGLIRDNHRENLWMFRNGYPVASWLSPVFSKKYAFLKGIKKIYLTSPLAYENWNHKPVEKVDFLPLNILKPVLLKLFNWNDSLLPESKNVIFYLNQPMHDKGKSEIDFLRQLSKRFPSNIIYVKLHPLHYVDENKLGQYSEIEMVKIVESDLPAELFIMNLKQSIILSLNSTSMFLDNPDNKFYYVYQLFIREIRRLRRYQLKRIPASHVTAINNISQISF